ncbi:MAG: single-stranded DNA-binding protein [Betaproteobacteria bacterium]|nr:single-stranded DNA-binding protein [Betaproteobacteria bacterium]
MSYQKIVVVGNLGSDAEVRPVKGDKEVTKFRLAQSDRFTQQTNWFQVEFWRGGAIAQYLTKGQTVLVEGRSSLVITADDVRLIGRKGGEPTERMSKSPVSAAHGEVRDDEIPF